MSSELYDQNKLKSGIISSYLVVLATEIMNWVTTGNYLQLNLHRRTETVHVSGGYNEVCA